MIAIRIVEILAPIFLVILVGLVYGKLFKPNMDIPNRLNMDIFIPCLLFSVLLQSANINALFSQFALAIALVILLSGCFSFLLVKLFNRSAKTICPPLMFANAGNLGLPLMVLTFGEQYLSLAVVMFVVCNFLHITLVNYFLSGEYSVWQAIKTPMVLSVVTALVFSYLNIDLPEFLFEPISMLGDICVPLMLFTLGVRLLEVDFKQWRIGVLIGLSKPVLGVCLVVLMLFWLDLNPQQAGILVLFGALPPAVMNFMFAEHFQQEPAKVAAIVLFGNALSVFTLPLALLYVIPTYS